jgi:hypothetical protein
MRVMDYIITMQVTDIIVMDNTMININNKDLLQNG